MVNLWQRWKDTNGPGKRQLILTFLWMMFTPVVIFTSLKTSLTYLIFVSQYTVIVGHWSAFQAATPVKEE